jgi:hypothetical protein
LLGKSEIIRVPVRCVWLLTGNNPAFSSEMARRTIRCRLDAKRDQPWLRTGFRHANIVRWAHQNRGKLVWAALTLIQHWIAVGRPPGKQTLGMFEDWAQTIGGILEAVGLPGFLGNLQDFYTDADADAEGSAWRAFLGEWWTRFGAGEVKVADVFHIAGHAGLNLDGKTEQSQRVRLGQKINEARERVFAIETAHGQENLRIERAGTFRRATTWRLARVSL